MNPSLWRVTFRKWAKIGANSALELKPQETVLTVAYGQHEAAERVRAACTGVSADFPTEIINAEKQDSIVGVRVDSWPPPKEEAPRV